MTVAHRAARVSQLPMALPDDHVFSATCDHSKHLFIIGIGAPPRVVSYANYWQVAIRFSRQFEQRSAVAVRP